MKEEEKSYLTWHFVLDVQDIADARLAKEGDHRSTGVHSSNLKLGSIWWEHGTPKTLKGDEETWPSEKQKHISVCDHRGEFGWRSLCKNMNQMGGSWSSHLPGIWEKQIKEINQGFEDSVEFWCSNLRSGFLPETDLNVWLQWSSLQLQLHIKPNVEFDLLQSCSLLSCCSGNCDQINMAH